MKLGISSGKLVEMVLPLRSCRLERRLSQAALARLVGVDQRKLRGVVEGGHEAGGNTAPEGAER
jgi:hypothetical protein